MTENIDAILRAHAELVGLRQNVNEDYLTKEFSDQYDVAVRHIGQALGTNLDQYLTPAAACYRRVSSTSPTHGTQYYEGTYVRADLFLAKFDSLLTYLKYLVPPEAKTRIGF